LGGKLSAIPPLMTLQSNTEGVGIAHRAQAILGNGV
jgi:hypothetical protein